MKRINPYTRLLTDIKRFCYKVVAPKKRAMWNYPFEKLDNGWALRDLWERTAAAETLGYDVQLYADKEGLHVKYVEKRPDIPWDWK